MKNKKSKANEQAEQTYTKAQFLASKQFTAIQRDFLNAILEEGKTYTMDQVKQLIDEYANKAVK